MQREQASATRFETLREQRQENPPESLTGIRLSRYLAVSESPETALYSARYREKPGPLARAQALKAFFVCPYPDDPAPLIGDTASPCEELREAAWRALSQIRHPAVRNFALTNAAKGIRTAGNFALLAANYMPEDGKLLEELLREMISAGDWDGVHWAGMAIFQAFDEGSGIPHPKHLLPLLYVYTPCSYCWKSALRRMARHRMLTKEILEECLYNSNDEIRSLGANRSGK